MIDLLIAAAISPIEAERQFAADAQEIGQWTAFRKWSTEDAIMFLPQPGNAHEFLKDRKDPATAVFWWPGRSYISCDGSYAINTGPWVREWGKSVGYFTTVWKREGDSWRWIYDAGDTLKVARAEGGDIQPVAASCDKPAPPPIVAGPSMPLHKPIRSGGGGSADGSLNWNWLVDSAGNRHFVAMLWNGKSWQRVITDQVAAPAE